MQFLNKNSRTNPTIFFYTLASKLWTIRRCLTLLWAYWTTMYIEISTHKFVSKWLVNLLNDSITNRISIFFYSHHRIAKRDEHRMTSIHAINGHTHTEPTTTKNPTHQNQIRKQRVHHKKKLRGDAIDGKTSKSKIGDASRINKMMSSRKKKWHQYYDARMLIALASFPNYIT